MEIRLSRPPNGGTEEQASLLLVVLRKQALAET